MPTVFHSSHSRDSSLELVHLADEDTGALVTIAPGRGGIVTQFDVGDDHVLYLDESTLLDPQKNVRGGIPVLFPTPGKLAGDAWSWGGRKGALPQHGFARNRPFQVVSTLDAGAVAAVALRLDSSAETRAVFPWHFVLEITYTLRGRTLRLDQRVTNVGDSVASAPTSSPMPFGLGFHPYFQVPQGEKGGARIETGATRAFDNVDKREIELVGIDLTRKEVDLHLLDHSFRGGAANPCTTSALGWSHGSRKVRVTGSRDYTHWVVWTLAGRDFVCLEPWTCPGNALNLGDRIRVLPPGESCSLFLEITFGDDESLP